jgi:hypothetical protein
MSFYALRFVVPLLLIGIVLSGFVSAGLMETDADLGYPVDFKFALSPKGIATAETQLLMRAPITVEDTGKIEVTRRYDGADPKLGWQGNEDVMLSEITITGNYDHLTGKLNAKFVSHVTYKEQSWNLIRDLWARGTLDGQVSKDGKSMTVDASIPNYYYSWEEGKEKKPENPTRPQYDNSQTFNVNLEGQEYDSQARFNSVTGEVMISPDPEHVEWKPVTPKTIIKVGDHISTGADSQAILQFKDMTTFQMKPETEVIVKTPPGQETKFGLVMGHLWANTKKMFTNGHMEVEMGQAVAGIKGTTFVCEETKSTSTLKVIEGTVAYTSKKNPKTVMVSAGEMVTAGPTGMQEKKTFDVEAEKKLWQPLTAKPGTTGTANQNTDTNGGQKTCSCIPLLPGVIALLGTALGSKVMCTA